MRGRDRECEIRQRAGELSFSRPHDRRWQDGSSSHEVRERFVEYRCPIRVVARRARGAEAIEPLVRRSMPGRLEIHLRQLRGEFVDRAMRGCSSRPCFVGAIFPDGRGGRSRALAVHVTTHAITASLSRPEDAAE